MTLSRLARVPRPIRLLLGLALGAILFATLRPAVVDERLPPWWCVICGDRGGADFILNVILFTPLGFALRLAGARRRRAVAGGAVLSLCIELTQAMIPGRDTSLGDVLANTTGTLVGFLLAALVLAAARRPRAGTVTAPAATLLALAVVALTGIALHPSFPPSTYYAQWTPDLDGDLEWYRGRVLRAQLGDTPVPSRRLDDQEAVHTLLQAGAPLDVTALAGPPPRRMAPLFSIYDDRQREILMIAPRDSALVLRFRTASLDWGLDRPFLTLPRALAGVRPGDTLRVTLWRDHGQLCLTLDGRRNCALHFTAGAGWSVLIFPEGFGAWVRALLGAMWVGGILLPAGFLARSRDAMTAVGAATLVGLAVVPGAVGLGPTPPLEWIGAAAGIALGAWARIAIPRIPFLQPAAPTPQTSAASTPRQRSIRP